MLRRNHIHSKRSNSLLSNLSNSNLSNSSRLSSNRGSKLRNSSRVSPNSNRIHMPAPLSALKKKKNATSCDRSMIGLAISASLFARYGDSLRSR